MRELCPLRTKDVVARGTLCVSAEETMSSLSVSLASVPFDIQLGSDSHQR